MKKSTPFRFKRFSVNHCRSSIKIGVDAVLVGALAPAGECNRILDVGCGCGVIALMLAQRNPNACITAIDIHLDSVEEARENFLNSPWSHQLEAKLRDFSEEVDSISGTVPGTGLYDSIVSNPPFFCSGLDNPETPRELARHQGALSPEFLVRSACKLLKSKGTLSLICPSDFRDSLVRVAQNSGLIIERIINVRGHAEAPVKRVVMIFRRQDSGEENRCDFSEENLVLEEKPGLPTESYRRLCKDFYLKF